MNSLKKLIVALKSLQVGGKLKSTAPDFVMALSDSDRSYHVGVCAGWVQLFPAAICPSREDCLAMVDGSDVPSFNRGMEEGRNGMLILIHSGPDGKKSVRYCQASYETQTHKP